MSGRTRGQAVAGESGVTPMCSMPQQFKSFLSKNWFAVLTLVGMAIHGWYTQVYAVDQNDKAIKALQAEVELLKPIPTRVQANVNELAELKRFVFKAEKEAVKFQRNMDRLVWVVDELARKNGITPPKQIPEQTYE
jgi:hypothetical protein